MVDIRKLLSDNVSKIDKIIEKYIPRKFTNENVEFIFGKASYKYNLDALTKCISVPIWDMLDRGGKRWRPTLFLLTVEALGGNPEKVIDFIIIPEVVHNATLVADDIEDKSEERRGKPCTYIKFGLDVAVNTVHGMFYLPLLPLIKNVNKFPQETLNKIYSIYSQEMINIGGGQGTDIMWHNGMANADNISEEEYLQMCAFKTGTLARMAAKIAAVLADANDETVEKIGKLAESIGVAFQIQDDILNITDSEVSKKKGGMGEDITEGKRTLMIIYTLSKATEEDKNRLIEILNLHTTDQNLRNEAIEILKKYDSVEYSKEMARKIVKDSWKEVDEIFPKSEAKEKLKAFADFLIERNI